MQGQSGISFCGLMFVDDIVGFGYRGAWEQNVRIGEFTRGRGLISEMFG